MKKYIGLLLGLLFTYSAAFASSDVNFPIKHQEIKPYPGTVEFVLNGENGMRNSIYYTMVCHITNPTQGAVMIRAKAGNHVVDGYLITVNNIPSHTMLNMTPGLNTVTFQKLALYAESPETNFAFQNFDNDASVFLEDCKATIEAQK